MSEPKPSKPKGHFGKIVLANLAVIIVAHVGRQLIDSDGQILGFLIALWLVNVLIGLGLLIGGERENGLACWLSASLIFIVGVSECSSHLHLGSMH